MKILKRLALGLAIITIIFIGAVFLAANLIDPNDYKNRIQTLAMEKTGRNLAIEGDIGLSYFPWVGLTLGAIDVSNPPQFGDAPFTRADSAQVKVKLLPLLQKSIVVDTIELSGLTLNLQRTADGQTNWDDLVAKTDTTATTDTATNETGLGGDQDSANPITNLTIGSIVIKDATINWLDQQNDTDARLTTFNLTSSDIELTKPFSVSMNFTVASDSMGLEADVDGTGSVRLDLDNKQYSIKQLKLFTAAQGSAVPIENFSANIEADVLADLNNDTATLESLLLAAAGVELSGEVEITKLSSDPSIKAKLKSNTFSPKSLAESLNIQLPKTADQHVLSQSSIDLSLTGTAQAANLDYLSIKLDDSTFTGNATLPDLTRQIPPVNFQFSVDKLDLDRYLPATVQNQNAGPNPTGDSDSTKPDANTSGDTSLELPVATMQKLNVNGMFKVDEFKASNLRVRNIAIPVSATDGQISLQDIKASLYEGDMISNVSIDVNSTVPRYQFSIAIDSVQAEPLLQDLLQDTAPLSGQAIVRANLQTTGQTVNQLTSALNGTFTSDFTDGAINGINVGYQLRRAKALFSNASEPAEKSIAKTDFSAMHISAVVNNGIIQSDDLDVRSPALRISGSGNVNLNERRVDYLATPKVVGTTQGQGGKDLNELRGVAVAIPVRGTFDELSSNFSGTVFAAMKKDFTNQAKDRARALAQKEKDKIKAEAKEKADAEKRRAREKIRAEQQRAEEKAKEKIAKHKEKAEQAAEEIKSRAKDKLKSLFK